MNTLPQALQQLIAAFGRLPGIGRKTATRLAFHILNESAQDSEELAKAILRVKNDIKLCSRCLNFSEQDICPICSDSRRNQRLICVVEDSQTILLIEKTNEFKGLYHVLGGVISPLDGIGPEELHIKELLNRLEGVEEVILALSPSTEGEATSIYLSRLIKPQGIKITRLARGIPLGSSLEFVDELTLSKALQSRSEM
ncbi:MAG: recombination protein RecR [Calditrichaceae bacterium]|nr:recombination mediator RecR [Calditrichia bacterium]NUQ43743.1 recombination protein RecR [Calditrichaceae bacterium]